PPPPGVPSVEVSIVRLTKFVLNTENFTSRPNDGELWDQAQATFDDELTLYKAVRLVFVFVLVSIVSEAQDPPENFWPLIWQVLEIQKAYKSPVPVSREIVG